MGRSRQARADDLEPVEEVIVRGRPAPGSGFMSRATLDDSAREVTDAASLLAPMAGVHVRRLGADDSFSTLSVRGTSSTEVAVILAGVPLTGGADPTLDLATLPLWPGAGARVYRSFAPAALGRGSLGGTLVIDPPSPRTEARTNVWAAGGSFGSRRIRLGNVTDASGVRIATGLSADRSVDDFSYLDPLATLAKGQDVFTDRTNAGHAAASGLASIAIPASHGALTITALAQGRRQQIPGTVVAPTPNQRLTSSRLLLATELTEPAGPGTFGARMWARREGLAIHDVVEPGVPTFGPTRTDDAIVAAGAGVGWKNAWLEARIEASGERYAPGTWATVSTPPGATRTNLGAAVDAEHRVRDLTLSASVRGDVWSDASTGTPTSTELRPTGHVGVEWSGPVVLAAHGGFLTRPASFVERFGDHGVFIGEPTLRPERARTIDGGARIDKKLGRISFHAETALFATWADDLIVFVARGAYGRSKAANIGGARIQGVEAEARVRWGGFDLRASYTGLITVNDSEPAGPALPGRPDHDVVGDLSWERGPLRLRYGVDVVAGQSVDLAGRTRVPDRVLQGAGLRVKIPRTTFSLGLDIRNLFDVRTVDYAGATGPVRAPIGDVFEYPLPGRSFLATARFLSK